MRAPSRDRRPSLAQRLGYPHLGLVFFGQAWFPRPWLGFLGLGRVSSDLAWFSSALAWFARPWPGFIVPWLGFLGFGFVFLVPSLGFTLPRLGFSNVGLVSPHVVAFLARASAKRCAYLKNYDR